MELKEIAKNIMVSCLAVKPTEDVLIITDDSRLTIGTALYEGAKELGCEALLMVMKERELSGEEAAPYRSGGHEGRRRGDLPHRQVPDPHQRKDRGSEDRHPRGYHARHHRGDVRRRRHDCGLR